MNRERDDVVRGLDECHELLGVVREQFEQLTQENERLRAELGRLDELQAAIERINQDNNRLRSERDELLAAFHRMAHLVDQVRHSRGAGSAG